MKTISVYVDERRYAQLRALTKAQQRPVAELLREAMADYVDRARNGPSMAELSAHPRGRRRGRSAMGDLLDDMRRR